MKGYLINGNFYCYDCSPNTNVFIEIEGISQTCVLCEKTQHGILIIGEPYPNNWIDPIIIKLKYLPMLQIEDQEEWMSNLRLIINVLLKAIIENKLINAQECAKLIKESIS